MGERQAVIFSGPFFQLAEFVMLPVMSDSLRQRRSHLGVNLIRPRRRGLLALLVTALSLAGCAKSPPANAPPQTGSKVKLPTRGSPGSKQSPTHPREHAATDKAAADRPVKPVAAVLPTAVTAVSGPLIVPKNSADWDAMRRAEGCQWATADGAMVLCWWQRADAEKTIIALRVVRAPGTEVKRFVLYDQASAATGPTFDPGAVRAGAIVAANLWLHRNRAQQGTAVKPEVRLTHNRLSFMWEGVTWAKALSKPPKVAPTPKLGGREQLCCRWKQAGAVHYGHCGLLALRFALRCDWHVSQRNKDDVCYDTALKPRPAAPVHAVHFLPVGGGVR
ncbi:MAG: hypothetical protein KC502_08565 [Myxococcales bacterium]|nr:hypothetical protein [Myxococcales bacterium]